jgi:hypothetical protein
VDRVHLYAGPSTFGLPPHAFLGGGIELHPPVRRGDIDRLIQLDTSPGVIVVCDGVFQAEPAVSHAELCRALDRDWRVWGVSSAGAIRAFELRHEGMRGFGYVHSQFELFDDFTDDEVCLLHFPEKPYFPVSEPLVNLRFALEQNRSTLGVTIEAQGRLVAALRELWFGDRTLSTIRKLMVTSADFDTHTADALLKWMESNRVKALDLAGIMAARPWQR